MYRPCLQLPLRRPLGPPDPGAPPCTRQRRLPVTAGDRHRRCVGSCTEIGFGAFQSVAPALGVEVSSIGMSATREIESALATLARAPNAGLIVTDSASAQLYRELIITLADRHKLPAPGTMPSAPGIACVMDRCSTQRAPLFTARRSGHSRPRKCLRNGRLAARDDRARNAGQERKAGDKDGWRLTCDLLEIIEVELGKLKEPITGIAGCCARAASGHAAALPISAMTLRRFMLYMRAHSPPCAPPTTIPARRP
jgi:hypothetical protein